MRSLILMDNQPYSNCNLRVACDDIIRCNPTSNNAVQVLILETLPLGQVLEVCDVSQKYSSNNLLNLAAIVLADYEFEEISGQVSRCEGSKAGLAIAQSARMWQAEELYLPVMEPPGKATLWHKLARPTTTFTAQTAPVKLVVSELLNWLEC